MCLSSSTRQAIQYKSSAKKLAHLCTELGGVNSQTSSLIRIQMSVHQWYLNYISEQLVETRSGQRRKTGFATQATDGYEVRVLTSYKSYSITDCRVINCMHGGSPTANVMSNNASFPALRPQVKLKILKENLHR